MNWSKISSAVGSMAPMLGSLLAGRSGAVIGEAIAIALGVPNTPEDVLEAINKPEAGVVLRQMQHQHREKLWELYTNHDTVITAAEIGLAQAINKTIQEEARAEGGFYRGWRPAFGYSVALAFVMNMVIIPPVLLWFRPETMDEFTSYLTATIVMWSMAFGVLGVYVHKRSQDKQLMAGMTQASGPSVSTIAKLTKEFHKDVTD